MPSYFVDDNDWKSWVRGGMNQNGERSRVVRKRSSWDALPKSKMALFPLNMCYQSCKVGTFVQVNSFVVLFMPTIFNNVALIQASHLTRSVPSR
jgi:hypothetical protein